MHSLRSTCRRRTQRGRRGPADAAASAITALLTTAAVAAPVTAAVTLLAAMCPAAAHAQGRTASTGSHYRNLVNSRFATISSGPQSSLIVDVKKGATQDEINAAVTRSIRADMTAKSRSMAPLLARMRQAGLLKKGEVFPVSAVVQTRQDGKLMVASQQPGRSRAVGNGELTFTYTGWAAQDRRVLDDFVQTVYPIIKEVYGAPAETATIEVKNIGAANETTTDVNALRFGYYEKDAHRINLPIYPDTGVDSLLSAFLLDIIHAFHGNATFQYDAWEEGFARATAAALLRRPEVRAKFLSPSIGYSLSFLQFYDLLNQPALGSPTFFPAAQANVDLDEDAATGGFSLGKMMLPRMGMSGAAWLKVYIEDQNFFRKFNEAYYAQFDPSASPSLAGNVPALRQIAGGIAPNVEGIDFQTWYQRQYILDTSTSVGRKLYAVVLPDNVPGDDNDLSHLVVLNYFNTVVRADNSVDEELLSGQRAYGTYFDSSNARLNFGQPAEEAQVTQGEAFFTVTTPQRQGQDATRITADYHVDDVATRAYFPAGFSGDFNGVILGPNSSGNVTIEQTSIFGRQTKTQSGSIEGSSFGVTLGTDATDLAQTVVHVKNGDVEQIYRVNTGDGLYYSVISPDSSGGAVQTLSLTLPAGQVPNLVSFPLRPLVQPIDQALGMSYSDFLLTYWDPLKNSYGTAVTDPGASIPAIAPGRGFWLKLQPVNRAQNVTINITGVAPATDTDFTVGASYGWNLIGSPFRQSIDLSQVLVKYLQNDPITWDEAVTNSYVAAKPFKFVPSQNPTSEGLGSYVDADALDGTKWEGYWVRVYVPNGVTLLLPGPDSPTSRAVGRRSVTTTAAKPDWSVKLRARLQPDTASAVVGRSAEASFGTVKGATRGFDARYDREAPPPIGDAIAVTFPHADDYGKASGGRFTSDFRESGRRSTYAVQVTTPQPGRVTLSWDNIGSLPRTSRATLVDKVTGEKYPMRSRSSITFNAAASTLSRAFEVQVDTAPSMPLMIQNFTVTRVPGRAALGGGAALSVGYTVSADADVTVEMSTLTGRVLKRLAAGRAEAAGHRSVVWDGRAEDGSTLPVGTYIIRVTARSDDGTQISQLRPFTLLR